MAKRPHAGPDLTLILSAEGVIQEAIVGASLSDERLGHWIGQQWDSIVADPGGKKVRRLLDTARQRRIGGFSQINQQLPSGREILMEFSAVRSDAEQHGIVAVGKNLGLVVEQQQKLVAAQQAIEQNYWKMRDIEARYQAIINSNSEATLVVRKHDMTVVEANRRAQELLNLSITGEPQPVLTLGPDTVRVENILNELEDSGQSPSTLVHLGSRREPWRVKAVQIHGTQEMLVLLQFVRVNTRPVVANMAMTQDLGRADQSVVIVNHEGIVSMASESFAHLAGAGGASELVGEFIGRWLLGLDMADLDAAAEIYEFHAQVLSPLASSRPVRVVVHPIAAASWGGFALTIEAPRQKLKLH